jgi:hypothetical protein
VRGPTIRALGPLVQQPCQPHGPGDAFATANMCFNVFLFETSRRLVVEQKAFSMKRLFLTTTLAIAVLGFGLRSHGGE